MLAGAFGILPSLFAMEVPRSAMDCDENDGLPVIFIETRDKKAITSKTEYKSAKMKILLNDCFSDCRNYYTDNVGNIQIRGRGNSTWNGNNVKHSYRIKLEKKSDLFGFGASKHWILLANYYDPTYLRNKMAYDLSNAIGMWSPESTWVVLYFNGKYAGLYQLCESIRVSDERVDITDWENIAEDVAKAIARKNELSSAAAQKLTDGMIKDLSWITSGKYEGYDIDDYYDRSSFDTTSGYLIEYDAFMDHVSQWYTEKGSPCMVKAPEYLKTNSRMFNYVKNLVQDFEDAVLSPTFHNAKGKHWSEYVDVHDLVDYWMVQNIMANGEFGIRSNYFYVENGKIHFGPNWDFDCGAGNFRSLGYTHWTSTSGDRNYFYRGLYNDPLFAALCEERWQEIRDIAFQLPDYMEALDTYIKWAVIRDVAFYPDPRMWWSTPRIYTGARGEYNDFHQWMGNRVRWLDEQLTAEYPVIGKGADRSPKLFLELYYESGNELPYDLYHPDGPAVSNVFNPGNPDDIRVECTTTHGSVVSMTLLVNGVDFGTVSASKTESFSMLIPSSALRTGEGDFNVISIIANNSSGPYRYAYKIIRSTERTLGPDDVPVVFDDGLHENYMSVEELTDVVLPDINVERDGFTALGWTVAGKDLIYQPGTVYTVMNPVEFRIKWRRSNIFKIMYEDELKEKAAAPVKVDEEQTQIPVSEESEKKGSVITWVVIGSVLLISAAGCTAAVLIFKRRKK